MKKTLAVIASLAAAAAITTAAGAYDINTDLGFGWSTSVTIAGSEFENVTTDTTVTITYKADETLADLEGQDYWCIKPMINDASWPFINTLNGVELSEGGDSYVIDKDSSSISFTIPSEELEHLQVAGMAIMGHGIELYEMTFSDESAASPVETPTYDTVSDAADETSAEVTAPTKGNPDTGVEGIAAVAGTAIIAAGVLIAARRK